MRALHSLLGICALLARRATSSVRQGESDGKLRRRRTNDNEYSSSTQDEIAQKFFLPSSSLEEIDMRKLIMEMNVASMSFMTDSPTKRPTMRPTISPTPAPSGKPSKSPTMEPTMEPTGMPSVSTQPTQTDCDNPGTCQNRLREQIYQVSERVGTVPTLDDPNSPQSKAGDWIIEECDASVPIDPCTESQILLNEQRYALAVMYFSLGGDEWNAGANPKLEDDAPVGTWLSGLNYCDWGSEVSGTGGSYKQLVCDEFGNVLNLNLQSNNMVGEIPPEIGVLVYMTSYISFFNAQTGPIPTSLGLITQLQTFDVESNNMNGPLFQSDYVGGPNGLKNVVNWRSSLNNFDGTIPAEIGEWTKIQNLWFADNQLAGTIPTEIGNLENMGAFLFYKNQIKGTIPTEIGNMNVLTWIDMEDNEIVGTIPESFYTNLDLEEVILKSNAISGSLSPSIGDLTRVATFWASFNQISGEIPTQFGKLLNIEELELQYNRLTGTLPSEFGNMESIEFLSTEFNGITGPIPPQLFSVNLAAMRILYLNNNELTGPVPENYGTSPRLKDLWLNDNQLTGTLPIIAEGEFLFLEELLVQNNDLTGVVDESVCLIRNNTIPGGNLGVFHADCQPPEGGGAPQIQCSCCTACFV